MDNVTIQSLNNISGSIIGDGVETFANCELKDCIVSQGHLFNEEGGKEDHTVWKFKNFSIAQILCEIDLIVSELLKL